MNELILAYLWILVNIFIGFNIIIFFDRKKTLSTLEGLGLSFPIGIGAVSIEMFFIGLWGGNFNRTIILLPWIILIIYNMLFLRDYFKKTLSFDITPLSRFEKLIVSFLSFEIIYTFFRALIKPIESYDSVAIYGLKSKLIYFAGTFSKNFFEIVANNFHGAHPDYPLFIPMSEAWFYVFINNFNDFLVKLIFPMYFISFIIVFYIILKRILGNRFSALLFVFIIASIKQVNDYATIGMIDLPMGINFSLSLFYLFMWLLFRKKIFFVISIFLSILSIWTKNEGIFLVMINITILFIYLFVNFYKRDKKLLISTFIYFFILFIIASGWFYYKRHMGLVNDNFDFSMINLKSFISGFKRIPLILYEYQRQIFGPKKWNIIWILILSIMISRFKKSLKPNILYITLAIILFILGYSLIYMLVETGPEGVKYYLTITFSRFMLHILPVCIFWIALMTKDDNIEKILDKWIS